MTISKRYLGRLETSALGLGCMGMSEFYGATNEKESLSVLDYAINNGVTLLDTADIYGMGANEELLAKAIAGRRDKVQIATKFGIVRDPNNPRARGIDGRPEYVRRSCDKSLKRLKTNVIDLYYLHRVDPNVPIEETVGAMSELVAEGKVRYIGVSEANAATIRRANAIHPLSAVQTEYSMGSREVETNDVLKVTRQLGIGFVAYSPLCRSLLTSQSVTQFAPGDARQYMPRFSAEHRHHNQRFLGELAQFANEKSCSLAQLSLAWLLAQGEHIVPIPGTKRLAYLMENIAAARIELTAGELREINQILLEYSLIGERYPADVIKNHNLSG